VDTLFLALRVVVALGVVVALLWVVTRRLGKGGLRRRTAAALAVRGRQSLGQKASVAVVEFDGRRFLLGVSEHGVTVLHQGVEVAEDVPETAAAPAGQATAAAAPDAAFARQLAATPPPAASPVRTATVAAPARRRSAMALDMRPIAGGAPGSPFAGSIFSRDTWRTAAEALRPRR
jgi:flagellar protein FliO/FliZ